MSCTFPNNRLPNFDCCPPPPNKLIARYMANYWASFWGAYDGSCRAFETRTGFQRAFGQTETVVSTGRRRNGGVSSVGGFSDIYLAGVYGGPPFVDISEVQSNSTATTLHISFKADSGNGPFPVIQDWTLSGEYSPGEMEADFQALLDAMAGDDFDTLLPGNQDTLFCTYNAGQISKQGATPPGWLNSDFFPECASQLISSQVDAGKRKMDFIFVGGPDRFGTPTGSTYYFGRFASKCRVKTPLPYCRFDLTVADGTPCNPTFFDGAYPGGISSCLEKLCTTIEGPSTVYFDAIGLPYGKAIYSSPNCRCVP